MLLAVNGAQLAVPCTYPPSARLIEVIRNEMNYTGVKLACGEGGCGACTVLVDTYNPESGVVTRCSLNSCLATVGSCDGAAVTTAEGLGNTKKGLHPAQEALAKRFASQCGFCTPGIAVALAAAAAAAADGEQAAPPGHTRAAAIAAGLDGNLCRCTGLRPILDACKDIADLEDLHRPHCTNSCSHCERCSPHLPAPEHSFPEWLKQYVTDKYNTPSSSSDGGGGGGGAGGAGGGQPTAAADEMAVGAAPVRPRFAATAAAPAVPFTLPTAAAAASGAGGRGGIASAVPPGSQQWLRPKTLHDLKAVLKQHSGASRVRVAAGNTGAGVYPDLWPHDPVVVDLSAVQQLKRVQYKADGVMLGAAVTIQQLIGVLRAPLPNGKCTQQVWAEMAKHLERIAGVHVRSAATLGGHFGLLSSKPLPTDLALVLAAAGANLQVLTVAASAIASKDDTTAAPAAGSAAGTRQLADVQPHSDQQQQQQQQQPSDDDGNDVSWISVEDYISSSCVGINATAAPAASHAELCYDVITAVWLPYVDDSSQRFWSYKLALRHFNSHALVNAAMLLTFDCSSAKQQQQNETWAGSSSLLPSSNASSSSDLMRKIKDQADPRFAGATIGSARVFVGFPSSMAATDQHDGAAAAAAALESWSVLRLGGMESSMQGAPVTAKALVSLQRQLEQQLSSAGLHPSSFHAQALQGIFLKALVPLIDLKTLLTDASSSAAKPGEAAAAVKVLRLFHLPASYDASILPEGRNVLSGFSGDEQTGNTGGAAAADPTMDVPAAAAESAFSTAESAPAAPVHLPIEKDAVRLQTSGEAMFTGDVAAHMGGRMLYLAAVTSSRALATVEGLDASAALALPGVAGLLTAADVPGANIAFDAPLLADSLVQYVGQPIALVAATSQALAERAASLVKVNYGQPPNGQTPILTIDQAVKADSFHSNMMLMGIAASRAQSFEAKPAIHGHSQPSVGQTAGQSDSQAMVDQIIAAAPRQIRGASYSLPAQQHMYMETQVAVAEPDEDGAIKVVSATQGTDTVQGAVAAVLGLPHHKVTVVTKRLGGAFGGKATRSMGVAAAAALAAAHFGTAACYNPSRRVDMQQHQGRCAGRVVYDVGFREDGKVLAVKAQVVYRAGAFLDLAFIDGMSMVAASDSAYDLSGLAVDVKFAKCNLPPHTIVRGPGFLQSVMTMDQVLEHVASELGLDSAEVKEINFLPISDSNASGGLPSGGSSSSSNGGEPVKVIPVAELVRGEELLPTPDIGSSTAASSSEDVKGKSAAELSKGDELLPTPDSGSSSSSSTAAPDSENAEGTSAAELTKGDELLPTPESGIKSSAASSGQAVKSDELLPSPDSDARCRSSSRTAAQAVSGQAPTADELLPVPGSSSSSSSAAGTAQPVSPEMLSTTAAEDMLPSVTPESSSSSSSRKAGDMAIFTEGRQCVGSPEMLQQHIAQAQKDLTGDSSSKQQQQQQQGELAPAGADMDDAAAAAVDAAATASLSWPGAAAVADTAMAEAAVSPCKAVVKGTPAAAGTAAAAAAGGTSPAAQDAPKDGVTTIFGRHIASAFYTLPRVWQELLQSSGYKARLAAVQQYNKDHVWSKRGVVMTPVRFDCAPTAVSAAVSVYADGTVLVTHGGVEMGQGLSTKVKQAAVAALSQLLPKQQRPLPLSLVRLAASSSAVVPNGGPTWSSTGSESNCAAVMAAAAQLVSRLAPCIKVADDGLSTWKATVASLFPMPGIAPAAAMLSAYGYFDGTTATAGISGSSGSSSSSAVPQPPKEPLKYNAFGAAVSEVELDVLTGERRVLSSHILYDCGRSLNPGIDLGQIEGAFVMGLGAMFCEDVIFDESSGRLLTAGTWGYKIPTPDLIPQKFTVSFLQNAPNPRGILSSKASGEPAIMTSASALLALQQAAAAAATEMQALVGRQRQHIAAGGDGGGDSVGASKGGSSGSSSWCVVTAPATPQKLKAAVGAFSIADVLEAAWKR